MINRNNYEIWFIDYLDGKLGPEAVADLLLFLDNNPDLAEELEGLNDVQLDFYAPEFPNKESLLKNELPISEDDVHLLLAKKLEGDLDLEDERFVDELISTHAEVASAWSMMKLTKVKADVMEFTSKRQLLHPTAVEIDEESLILVPDLDLVYPHKKALLKGAVVRPMWIRTMQYAAAAILLLLGWQFMQTTNQSEGNSLAITNDQVQPKSVVNATDQKVENEALQMPLVTTTVPEPQFAHEVKTPQNNAKFDVVMAPSKMIAQTANLHSYFEIPKASAVSGDYSLVASTLSFVPDDDIVLAEKRVNGFVPLMALVTSRIKSKIWGGDDFPEEDFSAALAEKAVEKVAKRTGSDMALVANTNSPNDQRGFYFKIGTLEVSH